ncbi:GreA/GreB family elongation factor [Candidatus Dojkabacteria bacterium]|uniref:GreA/GreB family elongation factor n=1 Tax=Candidatus Dojkabacteria bacterium TaxID=2099670 RepID=A0A955RHT0_9BACT|nr:GreA/GreB family elongation factor [Candidatus Dojkabacteria bacterium]
MKISKSKYDELQQELEYLETEGYQKVLEEEQAAGGPMESFHQSASAMEERKRWDLRVKELRKILRSAKVIDENDVSASFVEIGSKVTIAVDGKEVTYTIVESIEVDPENNKISSMSPLGEKMLGKEVGEEFELQSGKVSKFKIIKIN